MMKFLCKDCQKCGLLEGESAIQVKQNEVSTSYVFSLFQAERQVTFKVDVCVITIILLTPDSLKSVLTHRPYLESSVLRQCYHYVQKSFITPKSSQFSRRSQYH